MLPYSANNDWFVPRLLRVVVVTSCCQEDFVLLWRLHVVMVTSCCCGDFVWSWWLHVVVVTLCCHGDFMLSWWLCVVVVISCSRGDFVLSRWLCVVVVTSCCRGDFLFLWGRGTNCQANVFVWPFDFLPCGVHAHKLGLNYAFERNCPDHIVLITFLYMCNCYVLVCWKMRSKTVKTLMLGCCGKKVTL